MVIYIYHGEYKDKREELTREALELYAREELGLPRTGLQIKKMEGGKPYLEGLTFHFSVSHTDGLWGCLASESNVGLDIQRIKAVDFNRLAGRFFHDDEKEFVKKTGIDGFFDVWVRKESCIKFFGGGLLKDIKSFSVVGDGKPAETVDYNGSLCHVNAFDMGADVKCAYCRGMGGVRLWTRELR